MIVSWRASKIYAHMLFIITHSLLVNFAWSRDHLSGDARKWVGKIGYCIIGDAMNENLAIWKKFWGQCATFSYENIFLSGDRGGTHSSLVIVSRSVGLSRNVGVVKRHKVFHANMPVEAEARITATRHDTEPLSLFVTYYTISAQAIRVTLQVVLHCPRTCTTYNDGTNPCLFQPSIPDKISARHKPSHGVSSSRWPWSALPSYENPRYNYCKWRSLLKRNTPLCYPCCKQQNVPSVAQSCCRYLDSHALHQHRATSILDNFSDILQVMCA